MKKARETNENYEEGLLKLVRTLPTVRFPLTAHPVLVSTVVGLHSKALQICRPSHQGYQ